jgi:hypothetical protein
LRYSCPYAPDCVGYLLTRPQAMTSTFKELPQNLAPAKVVAWGSQVTVVPVLACSSTIGQALAPAAAIEGDDTIAGVPVPPVSVNHNFTPGSSAYRPEGEFWAHTGAGGISARQLRPESYTKFPRRWKGHDLPLMDQVWEACHPASRPGLLLSPGEDIARRGCAVQRKPVVARNARGPSCVGARQRAHGLHSRLWGRSPGG